MADQQNSLPQAPVPDDLSAYRIDPEGAEEILSEAGSLSPELENPELDVLKPVEEVILPETPAAEPFAASELPQYSYPPPGPADPIRLSAAPIRLSTASVWLRSTPAASLWLSAPADLYPAGLPRLTPCRRDPDPPESSCLQGDGDRFSGAAADYGTLLSAEDRHRLH